MSPPTHRNDVLRRTANYRSDLRPFWLKGLGDTFSLTTSSYEFAGTIEGSSSANSVHRVSAQCTVYSEPAGQTAVSHAGGAGSILRVFEATHAHRSGGKTMHGLELSGLPSGHAITLLGALPGGIPVYVVRTAAGRPPQTSAGSVLATGAAESPAKDVKHNDPAEGVASRQGNLLELLNQWSKQDAAADDPDFDKDFDELKSIRLKFNTRDD
jgi:hypothetical protein